MKAIWNQITKILRHLKHYPYYRDKALSIYNIILVSKKLKSFPFPGRNRVVNIIVNTHAYPFAVRLGSTDWLVLVEIFLEREYEKVTKLFANRKPEMIIDLGANAGFSVRYWLEMFPYARIIAIEPDVQNCAMINRNIALCGYLISPVVVQACIVGQPRESVHFETASGREWAYSISTSASPTTRNVRAITMDSLIQTYNISMPIDLLKCDIEGGEIELFKYCDTWIHAVRCGVIEVHGEYTVSNLFSRIAITERQLLLYPTIKQEICIFQNQKQFQ